MVAINVSTIFSSCTVLYYLFKPCIIIFFIMMRSNCQNVQHMMQIGYVQFPMMFCLFHAIFRFLDKFKLVWCGPGLLKILCHITVIYCITLLM